MRRIAGSGRIAAVHTVEGGHQIADDPTVLRMHPRLGVRSMTLTHFRDSDWVDSCTDQPRHGRLAGFGRQVVREMNRLGVIVDVSGVSDETLYAVLGTTTKPVIASHSSCRAFSRVSRNMTDDMIRALAETGVSSRSTSGRASSMPGTPRPCGRGSVR